MASAVMKIGRVIRFSAFSTRLRTQPWQFYKREQLHSSSETYASTPIMMPSLSPTMTEGTIVKWYKKEGDTINPGDVLCDIQTDKAVVSFDMEEEGILAKILKPENSTDIQVGTLIGVMVEEGEDWQNAEVPEVESSAAPPPPTPVAAPSTQTTSSVSSSITASPVNKEFLHSAGVGPSVRKLVEEYGVNVEDLSGSGPHNRLTKGDVLQVIRTKNLQRQALEAPPVADTPTPPDSTPQAPAPVTYPAQQIPDLEGEEFVDIPNTSMRSTIAKRLTLSKTTIPHSYVTMSCGVGAVTALRKQLVSEGVKVSVNDFIIKAAALALQRIPKVNTVWEGEEFSARFNVDISVAVATDNGLITPIVQNAPQLGVDEISSTIRDLADRARQNKLQLHEFQGGTFTISNLGMFGISEFSAVINPPQTAIMAVGSSKVVLGSDGRPESQMTVCLSYDARTMDDTDASQFLEVFKDIIESPSMMLSGTSLSKRASLDV